MASTNGLSKELLEAVGHRGETVVVEQGEKRCGFCLQSRVMASFTVKDGPEGLRIVDVCGDCVSRKQIRLMTRKYAESVLACEELRRRIHLFAEDIVANAVTETEVPGIAVGQEKFSCQFLGCDCGVKDVAKDATHQTEQGIRPMLYFVHIRPVKPDGQQGQMRPFVGCFTVVKQMHDRAERLGGNIYFRPLADYVVRTVQQMKPEASGRVIGRIEPVSPPRSAQAYCTFSEAAGDSSFKWPDIVPGKLVDESEVWKAITAIAERRRTIIGTHVEEDEDWQKWPNLRQADLKNAVKHCPVHGPEFRALTGLLSGLFDRGKALNPDFGKGNKPQEGARVGMRKRSSFPTSSTPAEVKLKPLCAKCGQVRVKRRQHTLCSQCAPKRAKASPQKKGGGEKKNKGKKGKK